MTPATRSKKAGTRTLGIADLSPAVWRNLMSGVLWARPDVLMPGEVLYKVTGSHLPGTRVPILLERQVRSPWWFAERDVRVMKRYGHLNAHYFGDIVRRMAAVKHEWSVMDTLVRAVVLTRLSVLRGPGRTVVERPKGATGGVIHEASEEIDQLYIPLVGGLDGQVINVDGVPALGYISTQPLYRDAALRAATETFDRGVLEKARTDWIHAAPLVSH